MPDGPWRSTCWTPGTQSLETPEVQVYRNAFPGDVCRALGRYILDQPERKMTHPLTDPEYIVPDEIDDALNCGVPFLNRGNLVITKRYEPGEKSDGFVTHRDPENFMDRLKIRYDLNDVFELSFPDFVNTFTISPLALCSLGGRAELSIVFEDRRLLEIECVANTVVVIHGGKPHVVTPPLDGKIRPFMFCGVDRERPTWASMWDEYVGSSIRVLPPS